MALPIGTRVRVLPPFDRSFPGEYTTVERPVEIDPETGEPVPQEPVDANWLSGVAGAFDDLYLEVI